MGRFTSRKPASRTLPNRSDPAQDTEGFNSDLAGRVEVVLVEPKYQGNIGAVARVMKNTGFTRLTITGNVVIGDEAQIRSMGGREILDGSRHVSSINDLDPDCYLVATSSVSTVTGRRYRRIPISVEELWGKIRSDGNRYCILFGREDDGLLNEEIEVCHYFVSLRGNPDYPVYNLSHAAAIILYKSLETAVPSDPTEETISGEEADRMVELAARALISSGYPGHKVENSMVMMRRIISRADLRKKEYFKLMGIIKVLSGSVRNKGQ
ncbi:MAG: RNA methyltransferase [Candidatus Thermoplasmatota archaeon]|nr:RNA methyltransferase [Candidatus Thermoplasmatota archaeon]